MRIASLLPAATEYVYALGHGSELVARTHECDHPPAAAGVPPVTIGALDAALSPAEIDAAVTGPGAHTGYALDADLLRSLEPEIVLAQSTCAVCAVDARAADDAVCDMPRAAKVVALDPVTLSDVVDGAAKVARLIDDAREGLALASHLRARLAFLAHHSENRRRPRVAVVEWPDPLYAPGHWVPDQIVVAGGEAVFGVPGGRSERATVEDLAASEPDVIVLAFCGYDLEATISRYDDLARVDGWGAVADGAARIYAADGSGLFSRPGPRLVDGAEALAWALHAPHLDLRPLPGAIALRSDDEWLDLAAHDVPPASSGSARN